MHVFRSKSHILSFNNYALQALPYFLHSDEVGYINNFRAFDSVSKLELGFRVRKHNFSVWGAGVIDFTHVLSA